VEQLLAWMRKVKGDGGYLLADENVRVTVNKQFAEPFTRLDPGDEVAIVPNSPNPPPPPAQANRPREDW
jgi:molybdopterin converting factor small subunit